MFQAVFDVAYSYNGDSSASKWTSLPSENESFYDDTLYQREGLQQEISSYSRTNNSSDWGPKRDPLYIVVPITVLYALIFFAGVIGNISTCIVIARNKCMHTATNYYLFSLAVSDLLLLISGLPPEIYSVWSKYPYIFGEAFCVLQGFAAETSANATVLTITAFTIERYVAICHPFLSHTLSKLSRAIKFIIGIWIVAMSLAVPQAISFGIIYDTFPDGRVANEEHYMCNVKRVIIPHAFEISTLLFFVAPMSMITVLYVLIGLQLHRSTVRPSRSNSVKLTHRVCKQTVAYTNNSTQAVLIVNGDEAQADRQEEEGRKNFSRNAQATKHVVKMLVAVVVAFFICWAPFHAQRLLAIYGQPTTANMITAFRVLTYISGVLYFLSTTINPLLYHIMSHRFREAFKDTFNRFFRRGRRVPGRCYTTLSGRSSQLNSHSNTDSCSRQSSLRYLDTEMARLQNSRRPLVVSFRRKKPPLPRRTKQVFFDVDLQEALDNLEKQPMRRSPNPYVQDVSPRRETDDNVSPFPYNDQKMPTDCSFVTLNNLEPKHICPLSNDASTAYVIKDTIPRIEDIEIFQEQRFKIHRGMKFQQAQRRQQKKQHYQDVYDRAMTKSCTMPQILFNQRNANISGVITPWNAPSVWSCDEESERSSSCSRLELIMEGGDKNLTCRHSDGIIIQVP